jgi:hypothetical protein
MSDPTFERLQLDGINFATLSVDYEGTFLECDFGSGYKASAIVGLSLREWELSVDVLVDLAVEGLMIDSGTGAGLQTRASYLWDFYCRRMDAGGEPFWVRDPRDGRECLAEFVDRMLTYEMFSAAVYASGLLLRQRRVRGVESPADPTAEVNTDTI